MKGMTMPFTVRDEWVFNVAQPGDELRGTLVVTSSAGYIQGVSVNKAADGAARSSTSAVHLPAIGEQAPDFSFVDQDGRHLRLRQLRGRPVLLTFIYTRGPLPDFCIRMSNNFAELSKELKRSEPALYRKLLLVSISIDPEYDTPAVLKGYGASYAGTVDPAFEHWKFVSGTPAETRKAADFFGLSYNREGGQIVHSLRTVLLAPNGTIAAEFAGNDWKPGDVEVELKKLIAPAGA
jgi:protein SCO1/2